MLSNKKIILGITGGIAAYKALDLASSLKKLNADIYPVMTKNAKQFINPNSFSYMCGHKCLCDCFDESDEFNIPHIDMAKISDLLLVAPASADFISKVSSGIADDMITTLCLSFDKNKLIAPAMNTKMYENSIIQENISRLSQHGYKFINPDTGRLACGDIGAGKLADLSIISEAVLYELEEDKILKGKTVTITAGATTEKIDPVRYITNHSSGKMGFALAKSALRKGAYVNLISKDFDKDLSYYLNNKNLNYIKTDSALSMFNAVKTVFDKSDYIIKAAAVADFTPDKYFDQKIKKNNDFSQINLKYTDDILKYLGEHKSKNQKIIGFSMETENLIENSKKKLINKKIDMVCANNIFDKGAGFGVDTNLVTLITDKEIIELPLLSKYEVANEIINKIYLL